MALSRPTTPSFWSETKAGVTGLRTQFVWSCANLDDANSKCPAYLVAAFDLVAQSGRTIASVNLKTPSDARQSFVIEGGHVYPKIEVNAMEPTPYGICIVLNEGDAPNVTGAVVSVMVNGESLGRPLWKELTKPGQIVCITRRTSGHRGELFAVSVDDPDAGALLKKGAAHNGEIVVDVQLYVKKPEVLYRGGGGHGHEWATRGGGATRGSGATRGGGIRGREGGTVIGGESAPQLEDAVVIGDPDPKLRGKIAFRFIVGEDEEMDDTVVRPAVASPKFMSVRQAAAAAPPNPFAASFDLD